MRLCLLTCVPTGPFSFLQPPFPWPPLRFSEPLPLWGGARIDPGQALKEGTARTTPASRSLNRVLVLTQVALSIVLITGAGLFVRTLQKLWRVDMGYDRENIFMFSVDAKLAGYRKGLVP